MLKHNNFNKQSTGDQLETANLLVEFIIFDHIYTLTLFHTSLFYALLVTPSANAHDLSICTVSLYMC